MKMKNVSADNASFVVDPFANKVTKRVHDPDESIHCSSSASIVDRTIIQPVD